MDWSVQSIRLMEELVNLGQGLAAQTGSEGYMIREAGTMFGGSKSMDKSIKGRVKKHMLGKLVDFSIKWVGGVPLVH